MRTILIILLVLAVVVGGIAFYLFATTPRTAEPLRIPLSQTERELLAHVPASAEAFALTPSAAALHETLLANPVTRDAVSQWTEEHELPRPWMLGGASIAAWKAGKTTSYAIRLDALRALLVRVWLMTASNADARWEGSTLIMHDPAATPRIADLDALLRLGNGLPEGDVLAVQRESARGAFPPIGRPAVTTVRITSNEISLVSRAATADLAQHPEIRARFARNALLSATFAAPPRILGDLNRLFGANIDALVDEGGSIALYGVDTGTFIPRPRGIISMRADPAAREQFAEIKPAAELVGETRDAGEFLLVSFDRTSMGLYLKDAFDPASWPATRWSLRFDPARMVPILRKAGDNPGLRIATPRIHRAARDLRRWIDALQQAKSVEAADSVNGGVEELRVRVVAR
ncbi:MAG: hypothetical protein M3Q69_13105 [Acidobacteriota bacterium]|nr:hypothetical protein [Acidobacteriota bacterium]